MCLLLLGQHCLAWANDLWVCKEASGEQEGSNLSAFPGIFESFHSLISNHNGSYHKSIIKNDNERTCSAFSLA